LDELTELVKQVQILQQTVEMQVTRSEQLFKMQEEVLSLSRQSISDMKMEVHQATLELQATREAQDLINEAQKGALSELDGLTDDLAKVTAALLQVQKQLQPNSQQASAQQ